MPTTLNDLPSELLAHIFTDTLPTDSYVAVSNDASPLVLSRVCHLWRSIALSSSNLWCSFQVKPPRCNPYLIQAWLGHSGDRLLSFKVEFSMHSPSYADAARLLRTLSCTSTRWKRVHLFLPGSNSLFRDTFGSSDMPHLRELTLDVVRGSEADVNELNTFLFSNDIPLENFTWGFHSSWGMWDTPGRLRELIILNAPWSRLMYLTLNTCVTADEAYTTLSRCPNLVEIDLRRFSRPVNAHRSAANLPVITLLSLTSLSLYTINLVTVHEPLGHFFSHLLCPNLRKVVITCGFTSTVAWPRSAFMSFLLRSSCNIERLHLESTGISESNLCQCLEVMSPSLRRLALYDLGDNACVSDRLVARMEGSLCPRLEDLVLHRVVRCSDGALAKMIHLRRESLQKFRWCPIPGDHCSHAQDVRVFKKVSGHGLEQTWEWEKDSSVE
ncbi:uncharacterized protein BT62DRAFT_606606 [Guyanagaster necrorhizus]|uniref:F-box domain-containing protein n=1 Tax=Guyanagaster necrorhizus TaxID=856835 RepID=A0A9P8AVP3_9AGAR|nr:uncharacterized protein BT62DRAFT_606606 [Guyanagaster necrorhizus MCA 3950]KAG7449779.1 hypothetical protein BT62DRAFT_606606 [Guyanagaster necrorhizus MCA 3950]